VELPPPDDGTLGLAELLTVTASTLAAAPSPAPRRAANADAFDSAKEALSLELATAQQQISKHEGALADMSLQLQKYQAQVKFLQISKGEMEAIAAGSGADVAGVSGLQSRLQAAQAEAAEAAAALRAVRETELPQEQARAMALRQEVFRLKEAALTSEEVMLEVQDEVHELRQQVRHQIHRPGFLFIDRARSTANTIYRPGCLIIDRARNTTGTMDGTGLLFMDRAGSIAGAMYRPGFQKRTGHQIHRPGFLFLDRARSTIGTLFRPCSGLIPLSISIEPAGDTGPARKRSAGWFNSRTPSARSGSVHLFSCVYCGLCHPTPGPSPRSPKRRIALAPTLKQREFFLLPMCGSTAHLQTGIRQRLHFTPPHPH
jgi:hypothetical protein